MRLLYRSDDGEIHLTDQFVPFNGSKSIPTYAILSHKLGDDEVTFQDFSEGSCRRRNGYKKLEFCAQQAQLDGLVYFWVGIPAASTKAIWPSFQELSHPCTGTMQSHSIATRIWKMSQIHL